MNQRPDACNGADEAVHRDNYWRGMVKIMTLNFQVTNFIHNVDLFFKQKEDGENNTSSAKFTVTIM